mmetsp:Transcript_25463/g.76469  ORF Transcript_25463/g.76469 Transcript_25463/m.76469 type:complete len:199 (+) Transcript_25463:195-791(+)
MSKRHRDEDLEEARPRISDASRRPQDAGDEFGRAPPGSSTFRVNREAEVPFLLRLFYRTGEHHTLADYGETPGAGVTPANEFRYHTWADCTLRELTDMVKHDYVEARRPRCQLSFAIVYPDKRGETAMKEVGLVWCTNTARTPHEAESKTLRDLRFQTGDYIDVAIKHRSEAGRGAWAERPDPLGSRADPHFRGAERR